MTLHRRDLLRAGAAATALSVLPRAAFAAGAFNPQAGAWKTYEIVTRLELDGPPGAAQAWIPLPSVTASDWIKPIDNTWKTDAAEAATWRDGHYGAALVHARWNAGAASRTVEVVSRFSARDRAGASAATLSAEERALYTGPTELIPTDGIVKTTSDRIVAGASTDTAKARAIYDWIVENTARDGKVRGCGIGDIASMLKSGNLTGKCADLNALFVGLARAAGLPARDLYGIRVAPSRFGYKSLGVGSEVVTKAQHCRAEVHIAGLGWLPVDPADVRKVMLEEPPGNLAAGETRVVDARDTLFGAWEGNWLAYNTAHDIALPGSSGPKVAFLMYPQAETAAGRLDCLDPDTFRYTIRAKEVNA